MPRLSSVITKIKPRYDVVVVGSGYGGSIAASRLSRAGLKVCLLERGREFQPGDFPDTLGKAFEECQFDLPIGHFRSHTALFDFRFNHDMNAVVGCGLGGTSLINANVVLRPENWVLEDPAWPEALRKDTTLLNRGFEHVKDMLNAQAYQPHQDPDTELEPTPVPKLLALEEMRKRLVASGTRAGFERSHLAVNFKHVLNRVNVEQHACALCGDCVSGCNYGAKNTLLVNYLPDAKAHGTEIYTEVTVRHVEKWGNEWLIHYDLPDSGRTRFTASTMAVRARIVVLAAGTFGSTEILLRSRREGLSVSKQLGHNFSGNGDVLALAYNTGVPINGIGFGQKRPTHGDLVGPCITGTIDLRDQPMKSDGVIVQDGSIPGALAGVIPIILAIATILVGRAPFHRPEKSLKAEIARWRRFLGGPRGGAARNSQTFLVMGHDNGGGKLTLEGDRLRLHWPNLERQPLFRRVDRLLHEASSALGGIFLRNPFKPVTVHPLGGCRMAEDTDHGVVNHEGKVFNGSGGSEVHEGLYVCDGAVIPRPLGANPLFTISALAERMCALLVGKERRKSDYAFPRTAPEPLPSPSDSPDALRFSEVPRLGLQFTERIKGYVSKESADDYRGAFERGLQEDLILEMTVTVISDDLESLINDWHHSAHLVGTVTAKWLSSRPMTIRDGEFRWFILDPDQVETRYIRYTMSLVSETGESYKLDGYKVVKNSHITRAWSDLTTLYVTVTCEQGSATVPWKGQLRVDLPDLLRSLRTIRARHARGSAQRLDARARYIGSFATFVRASYGRVFAPSFPTTPDVPPKPRNDTSRSITKREPDRFDVRTSDTTKVHLTRYQGGRKGPVLLSPGFGVAASSFKADTVKVNIVDYLCDHGYDVWLLDYRASPDFPSANQPFTIDDIALRDYPAVVQKMRAVTRRPDIQAVVHCIGSLSFFMSLLSGSLTQGTIRSVIASQLGVHPITPALNELKVALRLSTVLRLLGVTTMTTDFNPRRWSDWAIDELLRLLPTPERCNNPVCRRILFVFGESYRHDQLNTETHDAIDRWFGDLSLKAMGHLSRMVRAGHAVDAEGQDVYLPHAHRLALPISFMHGALNREFLPKATRKTFEWLGKRNNPELYRYRCFEGYGHMDCFVGKRAADDIYGWILSELERFN
jgi:cholesterol oxidase